MFGFFALLLGQIFGNSVVPIGTKIASPWTGPVVFVFLRFVVASMVLFLLFLFTKRQKISKREYLDFAFLGFLLMLNVFLFTIGISYTTIIMSTLIYSVTPILVGIGGHYFLSESFTRQKIGGLIVSLTGLLFLTEQSVNSGQKNVFGEPLGNILISIAMLGYSYYVLYSRQVLYKKNHQALQTTVFTFGFTALFLGIILLLGLVFGQIALKPLPAQGIAGFFIVGVGTVIQYLFLQIGVKRTNAFTASLFQYTGPFIAASIAIPWLHEVVTLPLIIGGGLILLGVFIATTQQKVKKQVA